MTCVPGTFSGHLPRSLQSQSHIGSISSSIIWGVPSAFRGAVGQSPFSGHTDLTVAFTQSARQAVPSGITFCVSGSLPAPCDCPRGTAGPASAQTCPVTRRHSKPDTAPRLVPSRCPSRKVLQGAGDTGPHREPVPLHYVRWFHTFPGFCLLLHYFLGD